MKRRWILALVPAVILALFLVGCGEAKIPLTQYQELEKKYQVLAQDVKTLQKTQGELAQQKAEAEAYKKGKEAGLKEGQAELAQQKAEAYEKGKADGLATGKAAGYREGWEAYSKLWPYSPYPIYPPYPPTYPPYPPVYPGKFVASVYQGDEFDGGYVGSFESSYPINYDWGLGGPLGGLTNYFSVRWEGTAWFETGNYRFRGRADDGFRLYVDGRLLLDTWSPQTVRTHEVTHYLTAGYHSIRLEYRERTGYAQVSLFWERN
ncbi:MAG: PA14 domain-containing protein [bacterium]|nr:PA14 domain-containing protein [bacterium]